MFLYVGGARCVEKNIAGERKMKKNDSVKRLIILALGLIGPMGLPGRDTEYPE